MGRRPTRDVTELDVASAAEFGIPLKEVIDLMIAAVNIARTGDGKVVARLERQELESRLVVALGWPPEQVSSVVGQLTLMHRPDFLSPPAPFTKRDVYPWKFIRALSYLRRPFVAIPVGDSTMVMWGPRHVYVAARYLLAICYSGRLPAKTPEMRGAMSASNDRRGKEFNDEVASVLGKDTKRVVRSRATTFGSLRLPKEFGDIDVLAVDEAEHVVRVIECKDLALARTPDELSNQLTAMLPRSGHEDGSSDNQAQEARSMGERESARNLDPPWR